MGLASGFLLVVGIGVSSVDANASAQAPSNETVSVELAPAVVVAAGADSIDPNAIARISALHDDRVEFGTGFQLDDGRIATVAHALVDARSVRFGTLDDAVEFEEPNRNPEVAITRLHDVATLEASLLSAGLPVAEEPAAIGQGVALAGIPEDGRIHILTGEIIGRSDGASYGIGRPEVYAISASVDAGYSGGPVVNALGEVVAVIVGSETVSGVTLAVPIEHLPAN